MTLNLADLARRIGLYDLIEPAHRAIIIRRWKKQGRPAPAPSAVKRKIIRDIGRHFQLSTLVETGTFKGDTVRGLRRDFQTIYSIELDDNLYEKALLRCRRQRNVRLLHGDSGLLIEDIIYELSTPALFWLDAHYSGGVTARTEVETPILAELSAILSDQAKRHVVLIDDLHKFTREDSGYPSLSTVSGLASRYGYEIITDFDIIRLIPPGNRIRWDFHSNGGSTGEVT